MEGQGRSQADVAPRLPSPGLPELQNNDLWIQLETPTRRWIPDNS